MTRIGLPRRLVRLVETDRVIRKRIQRVKYRYGTDSTEYRLAVAESHRLAKDSPILIERGR
jgi:hypothetical protein